MTTPPAERAEHVKGCERCQRVLLEAGTLWNEYFGSGKPGADPEISRAHMKSTGHLVNLCIELSRKVLAEQGKE